MKNNFSEKEIRLCSELRELVDELLEDDYEKTDDFLITWIQFANYDVRKAERALRNNKKWRQENKMDKILLEDMKELHEKYPIDFNGGFDKLGCPILIVRLKGDIRELVNGSPDGKDRYVRFILKHCEQTVKIIKQQYFGTNGEVTRFSGLIDMDGFCFRQLLSPRVISALTEVAKHAESNYPGTAKTLYVLNAPKALKFLLNIMKPFLSADTMSRLKLFDSNKVKWKAALLEDISEDQLPSFLEVHKI